MKYLLKDWLDQKDTREEYTIGKNQRDDRHLYHRVV